MPRRGIVQGKAVIAARRKRGLSSRDSLVLLLLALPGIAWFAVFAYGPMAGLVVAFKDFNVRDGIFGSPWNGFANFRYFLASGDALTIVINTLFLNALFLSASLLAGLILALMLNEIRGSLYRRFMQSTIFFPYFVSPIVISIMLQVILSGVGGSGGLLNNLLSVIDVPQVSWYTEPGAWPWYMPSGRGWKVAGSTAG